MTTYREWQPSLHPTGLAGTWGLAWGATLGEAKDTALAQAKDATKARFVDLAPSDALPYLGADTQIDRAPGEAEASWRDRIRGAWESWRWVGTRYGIGRAVSLLGYGWPAVWTQRELPRPELAAMWARMTLVFTGRESWGAEAAWGAFDWAARLVQPIEGALTAETRTQLRQVLRRWIGARDHVTSVVVAFGATLWGLGVWGEFTWGDGDAEPVEWFAPAWGSDEAAWGGDLFAWGYFI